MWTIDNCMCKLGENVGFVSLRCISKKQKQKQKQNKNKTKQMIIYGQVKLYGKCNCHFEMGTFFKILEKGIFFFLISGKICNEN